MCNLYSVTTNIEAIRALVRGFEIARDIGNFEPMPAVFPDSSAPIVRNRDGIRELTKVRWGMPSSSKAQFDAARLRAQKVEKKQGRELTKDEFAELLKMEPDRGTTNVRNTASAHWRRWLAPENRCVVPFTSFSEFNARDGGDVWFAFDEARPLAFFAGIWAPQWASVRKVKEGLVTTDLFAFLTTGPNDVVGAVHPKAMPAILTKPDEIEAWLTQPWAKAKDLQRPLPDGALQIVARGVKKDER